MYCCNYSSEIWLVFHLHLFMHTYMCACRYVFSTPVMIMLSCEVHCKKCGVTEHPKGAIFYCFHGNPYCYHGNSTILLPWGVQLHRIFYSVPIWNGTLFCTEYQQCSSPGGSLTGEWVLTDVADNTQLGTEERIRNKGI